MSGDGVSMGTITKVVDDVETVGNGHATEIGTICGMGKQLRTPHDGALSPLHKRKRRALQQSVKSTIISSGCQWNPLRGIEMKRHDCLSEGLLASTEVTSQELSGEDLQNEFKLDGRWVAVKLSQEGLTWEVTDPSEQRNCKYPKTGTIALGEVLGVEHNQPKEAWRCTSCKEKTSAHKLIVHSFSRGKGKQAEWNPVKFAFSSSEEATVAHWGLRINSLLSSISDRPRKLWVFVNPYGGKRQAKKIWQSKVHPLFQLAGIACMATVTTHKNHAYETIKDCAKEALLEFDGIIAVGGDGFFQEIVNGILNHYDKPLDDPTAVHHSLRLGHIPAGSTDAISWSLHGTNSIHSAAMRIVLGDRLPLDVMKVSTKTGSSQYSTCMAGYGFFGDTIRTSDRLRWMGPMRYDIAGAVVFLMGRSHRARVLYKPAGSPPPMAQNVCLAGCTWCQDHKTNLDENSTESQCDSLMAHQDVEGAQNEPPYKVIEGKFMSIIVTVTSCRNDQSTHGVTPHAHLGDGRIHLMLVRKTSRIGFLKFLLSLSKDGVRPGKLKYVDIVDATAVRIEPMDGKSVWNVDGELLLDQELSTNVRCRLLQVFSRGIEI